jgi:hypothetical protein
VHDLTAPGLAINDAGRLPINTLWQAQYARNASHARVYTASGELRDYLAYGIGHALSVIYGLL